MKIQVGYVPTVRQLARTQLMEMVRTQLMEMAQEITERTILIALITRTRTDKNTMQTVIL